jgi:hypothetical protein
MTLRHSEEKVACEFGAVCKELLVAERATRALAVTGTAVMQAGPASIRPRARRRPRFSRDAGAGAGRVFAFQPQLALPFSDSLLQSCHARKSKARVLM